MIQIKMMFTVIEKNNIEEKAMNQNMFSQQMRKISERKQLFQLLTFSLVLG